MELNQYIYMRGEVCKLFQYPQGPDSDFFLYRDLGGKRRTYFDTTSTTHANFEPVFVVVPHAPGEKLADNGLPVFEVDYTNDDASDRSRGRDSWLSFTAPADGSYLVRVCDSRGARGAAISLSVDDSAASSRFQHPRDRHESDGERRQRQAVQAPG